MTKLSPMEMKELKTLYARRDELRRRQEKIIGQIMRVQDRIAKLNAKVMSQSGAHARTRSPEAQAFREQFEEKPNGA